MTVKVAFIGAGGIANAHLNALKTVKDAKIVGLCDVNETTLQNRQKEFGGDIFSDPEKMLQAVKPDTAYICLPPFAHGAAEEACLKHKIPFLVEKPITKDLELAKKLASEIKKNKIMAAAAYMTRFRKGVARAKELLAKDPPAIIFGGWVCGFPGSHPWLFDKELSGGQLMEQTTHTIDLMRYLCGDVKSVHCYRASNDPVKEVANFKADCASTTAIKLASGAVASIMSAWVCKAKSEVFLTLVSPNYRIEFSGWENSVRIFQEKGSYIEEIKGEGNIFEIEDAAWIKSVKSGKLNPIFADYEDAVKTLAVSAAANESMETGMPVRLS
ncbi:MAG: hypothetical protein A2X49_10100 [Lentisphaerae bacterium GWF2_52_8]|nr:MAG: hypothetical protein A2X49_10100 [Lentisphaerae bacterium GWF2_52_8]